ncbi:MAG: AbrB/MazE/SpoVT family DNA-binding domain-containing protein [Mesorhizobium sp.]|jgi:putative addiction module antidote
MYVTLRKIGNSEGVIIPKEVLERHNLRAGDQLELTDEKEGFRLIPTDDVFERQMKAALEVMDRYKVALQKLAE